MQASVIIPAYKPAPKLVELVRELRHAEGSEALGPILILDDGSGAGYQAIFDACAAVPGAHVVRHAVNLGKGAALKTAINHALVRFPELRWAITVDADGQHLVTDVIQVAKYQLAHPDSFILGTRSFGANVPLRSKLGNLVTAYLFFVLTGAKIRDTQTGLRSMPVALLHKILKINLNGYDFELECLLTANAANTLIEQVPIQTVYIDDNSSSHFNPILDSSRIYFVLLRYFSSSTITAFIDYTVFWIVFSFCGNAALSQVTARAIATGAGFMLSKNVVFHSKNNALVALSKYLALVVVSGSLSYAGMQYLSTYMGMSIFPAKLLAEGLLFIGNFAVQREFIFRGKRG